MVEGATLSYKKRAPFLKRVVRFVGIGVIATPIPADLRRELNPRSSAHFGTSSAMGRLRQ